MALYMPVDLCKLNRFMLAVLVYCLNIILERFSASSYFKFVTGLPVFFKNLKFMQKEYFNKNIIIRISVSGKLQFHNEN